jgi:hypothetical protein
MCGGGTTTEQQNPQYFGPYGQGTAGSTTGQSTATDVSNASQPAFAAAQTIGANSAGMASSNAQNPGYGTANGLYNSELQGNYLNGSPALSAQENSNQTQANRAAGDQAAQIKGSDARAGMSFSTADQQAQQGAEAQQNANAMNTNAQLIGNNYANERGIQNQAGAQMNQHLANQLNMNQAGISALYSPLTAQANLNTGLWAGGQVSTPNAEIIQNPGPLDYAGQILGML